MRKKSNDLITNLIVLCIAIGTGSFVCAALEHAEMYVWLARGIGACATVTAGFLFSFILRKLRYGKNSKDY